MLVHFYIWGKKCSSRTYINVMVYFSVISDIWKEIHIDASEEYQGIPGSSPVMEFNVKMMFSLYKPLEGI